MRRYGRIGPGMYARLAGPEGGEIDYNKRMEGIQQRQAEAIARRETKALVACVCLDCGRQYFNMPPVPAVALCPLCEEKVADLMIRYENGQQQGTGQ